MAETETTNKQEVSEPNSTEDDLPQKILEKYSSDLQVQLIKGYRILQVLMYYLNNSPFFEKPENKKYRGKFYYDVIKNPMWFNEIKRKMFNAEYNSLFDIIKDMRLVFENCYYFWGPKTDMSEQCVKMERLMEKQLLSLPKDLKNMCSLEETHGKNEDEVVTKIWNRYRHKGKGCSNLMLRTWRKKRINETKDFEEKSDLSNYCDCKEEIEKWEKKVLQLKDHATSISNTVQLPQIGIFFHLIHNILDVKPYCQMEIERMFLIPQYSIALRQILTALLINKHSGDLPSYEDLMDKLKITMDEWYSVYEDKNGDEIEASLAIGIEEDFFTIIGDSNPLLTQPYEDLEYRKKVVIVKSLCDCLMNNRLDIEEEITQTNKAEFIAETIGRDKLGYSYLFFKKFLDFRLYKQKSAENVLDTNKESSNDVDDQKTMLNKIFLKGSSNFEIVAESTEELRCLIDDLMYSDVETSKKDCKTTNSEIIDSLRELENRVVCNENVYIERSNDVRIKMFTEWKDINQSVLLSEDDEANENMGDICSNSTDGDRDTNDTIPEVNFVDADHCVAGQNANVDDHMDDESNHGDVDSNGVSNDELEGCGKENDNEELSFEADIEDFQIKAEIKDEPQTDDTSSSETVIAAVRRRRSSVPSYNVFDKKLFFSDESESDSPEDIYTEGDDSDDDWDVPKKKSKKTKNKFSRQLKMSTEDNNKRKRRNSKKNEPVALSVKADSTIVEPKMELDCVIKKEEPVDIEDDQQKEDDKSKSGLKIKVVDLAKLQKSDDSVSSSNRRIEPAPLPRIVSQGTLRAVSQNAIMNPVPVINSNVASSQGIVKAFSNVRPSFAIVGQPQVFSNAYIIAADRNSFQTSGTSTYPVQQLSSPMYRASGATITRPSTQNSHRMLNSAHANNRFLNAPLSTNKLVFVNQNSSLRYSSSASSAQNNIRNISSTMGKSNGIAYNKITPLNKLVSFSAKTNYMNNAPSKMGRNVTVTPNIITKTYERRNTFKEIEGTIGIHHSNGTLQYVVNLANGTHVPLSNIQVQKLRDGNNGALPLKLKIPVPYDVAEKIEPCVVIDD